MARRSDNAPIGHTCPMIDTVISFLEKIDWDLSIEDEKDLDAECKEVVQVMEDIRAANDTLRTWGNEECNSKNEIEQEKEDLERIIETLKYDLSNLSDEIKELKEENEILEEKLNVLN